MFDLQGLILRGKKRSLNIAVDIGSSNLKIAAISRKEGVVKLENFAIKPILAKESLPELIKKSFNELCLNVKSVSTSLSGDGVILRYIYMPRMSKGELKSSLHFEVSKYIPINLDNVSLDSEILKSDCPDNKMFVLIAAVEKPVLEERIKLLKLCGLSVKRIDVDSLATINAFNYFYYAAHRKKDKDKESVAVLDLGAKASDISVLEDGIPCFTRAVLIAGDEFDKRISGSLNVSEAEAKKLKENIPDSKNEDVLKILITAYSDLLNEIQISFDYFESHFNTSVKKIFLLGGASKTFGLKDTLAKSLGIEVIEPDISEGVLVEEGLKNSLQENYKSLAVALGLGLRDD